MRANFEGTRTVGTVTHRVLRRAGCLSRSGLGGVTTVACGAALLAGCGSSDSTSSATSSSTLTISSAAPLTSPVYQVPQYEAGMQAAVKAINARGGVAGKQLALDVCDTGYSANGEIGCARKLAAGSSPVVVGPDIFVDGSGAAWKVLAGAKLPVIGSQGGGPAELNSPNVYPLSSGNVGGFVGAAASLTDAGARRIALMIDTNPSGRFAADLVSQTLKRNAGIAPVGVVTADTSSDPTYATAAARVGALHAQGTILIGAPVEVTTMVKALRGGGYSGKLATASLLMPQESLDQLKELADGILLNSNTAYHTDTSNPGVEEFRADMAKYEPKAAVDDTSLAAWSSVRLFAAVAAKARSLTKAGITQAADSITTPVDIRTIGPWASQGRRSPYPAFTRVLNSSVALGVVSKGVIRPDGQGFVDPVALLGR